MKPQSSPPHVPSTLGKKMSFTLNLALSILVMAATTVTSPASPLKSSFFYLTIVLLLVLMHSTTTIDRSTPALLSKLNSLIAGVMFPVLLDEVHAMHDIDYALRRDRNGFSRCIPFIVLLTTAFLETPSTEALYRKWSARARLALLALDGVFIAYYMDMGFWRPTVAMFVYFSFQGCVPFLRERCSLSLFEALLVSSLAGFAINSMTMYTPLPGIVDYSSEVSINIVLVAVTTMIGVAMAVSVLHSHKVQPMSKAAITCVLAVDTCAVLSHLCVIFKEPSFPTAVIAALQWLGLFFTIEASIMARTSAIWVVLIVISLYIADYVSKPHIEVLHAAQEQLTPAGIVAAVPAKFTLVKFDQPLWPQTASRKLFHFLLVAIVVPPMYLWQSGHQPFMVSFSALSLGGIMCVFVLLELLRARSLTYPPALRSALSRNIAIYFDRFAGPKRRWAHEISMRDTDYKPSVHEAERLHSSPGWSVYRFTGDHVSLLLGCAIPVWYYASFTFSTPLQNKGSFMLPLMGCLCVGCGDSFSAIFGSRYGTTRWSSSESGRTVEGSMAAWIGQAAIIAALFYPPFQDACFPDSIVVVVDKAVPALLAMTLGTLVEAFAADNDNLLLAMYPIIAYGALLLVM